MSEEPNAPAANTNTGAASGNAGGDGGTGGTTGGTGGSPPAGTAPDAGMAPPASGTPAAAPEGNTWDKVVGAELSSKLKDAKPEEVVKAYLDRPTVPEEYKLPKDFAHKDFADVAKNVKMTQEQVDSVLKFQKEKTKAYNEDVNKLQKKALEEFKKEKGAEWDDTVRLSRGALNYLDEEDGKLRTFLRETGAGAQPIVIDLFAKIGKLLEEDRRLPDDPIPRDGSGKTTAKILYPDMK